MRKDTFYITTGMYCLNEDIFRFMLSAEGRKGLQGVTHV
jgi:hypothetical protein